jgi:type I restriction enzyme, S subunit
MNSFSPEPIYGLLPYNWILSAIGILEEEHIAQIQTGPFGTMLHASAYTTTGTPVVAVQHIGENKLKHSDLPLISPKDRERLSRYALVCGDIVFGRKGAVERRALVTKKEEGWLQGSDCIRVRFTQEVCAKFISYILGSASYKSWITRNAQGATMPSLNQEIIRRIPIPLPPLQEQHSIAHILGTLDDKIELNRQMNQTLEAMARVMFKSWFVDFDPVRAKAEGRMPVGMDAEAAALFPDSFEESELGEIPKGWRVDRLDELLVLQRGFDLPTTQRTSGRYPIISAGGSSGSHNEFKVKAPGVVTGRSGVLGKVFFVQEDFWPLNTSLYIKQYKASSPTHAYHLLQGIDFSSFNAGSAVPTLNRNHVHNLPQIVPPKQIVQDYEKYAELLFRKCRANDYESQALIVLRDELLPKLLSGELRVKDAKQQVEAVL